MTKIVSKIMLMGLLVLGACAPQVSDEQVQMSAELLYNIGKENIASQNYIEAADAFEEVERQHPYSQWAVKGQLMAAYSYYLAYRYTESVLALQRFIELNPGHPDSDYAHFLLAVSYYDQISDVERDQDITRKAFQYLEDVMRLFPKSEYARDAKLKMDLTIDHLAGKEMEIGRYYQKRGNFGAAINRYRIVVEQFPTTTQVPEALLRLTESYVAMGIIPQARQNAAVLGHNFPQTQWYEQAFALVGDVSDIALEDDGLNDAKSPKTWLGQILQWAS